MAKIVIDSLTQQKIDARRRNTIYPGLEEYIQSNYVDASVNCLRDEPTPGEYECAPMSVQENEIRYEGCFLGEQSFSEEYYDEEETDIESELDIRMQHLEDSFSEYLFYMIKTKNLQNTEVYKKALVDKKIFSKIKKNPDYHPSKLTVMCLCVGMELNLDETKDLMARAGYAFSSCDKTDVIFSYFIENQIYDMIEIDIQLENHNLPCIIK